MPKREVPKARILDVSDIPTDRPVITLDIDGVLNAFDHGRSLPSWQKPIEDNPVTHDITDRKKVTLPTEMCEKCGYREGQSFVITWARTLMDDIAELAESGRATIVWLTSWNEFADWLGDECFWPGGKSPATGCIDCTIGGSRSSYAGKIRCLREICDALVAAHPDGDAPPVVSFDDDAPWDYQGWGRNEKPLPGFFHGIQTDPRHGITMTQWEEMLEIVGR